MLKDELLTKKERDTQLEDQFNKIWYNELKEQFNTYIKEFLFKDLGIVHIKEMIYGVLRKCPDVQNPYHPYYYYFMFNFLRSKLWNEGFNLFLTQDHELFIKLRKNEKYKDSYIMNISTGKLDHMLNDAMLTEDYSKINKLLSDFEDTGKEKKSESKKSSNKKNKNSQKTNENIIKGYEDPNLISINTPNIMDTPNLSEYIYCTEANDLTGTSSIHTISNGQYESVTYAMNENKDEIK